MLVSEPSWCCQGGCSRWLTWKKRKHLSMPAVMSTWPSGWNSMLCTTALLGSAMLASRMRVVSMRPGCSSAGRASRPAADASRASASLHAHSWAPHSRGHPCWQILCITQCGFLAGRILNASSTIGPSACCLCLAVDFCTPAAACYAFMHPAGQHNDWLCLMQAPMAEAIPCSL